MNDSESNQTGARYIVGIDLGTTNCAVAFVDTESDTEEGTGRTIDFPIPQWIDVGQIESRATLPSFHYQWTKEEAGGDQTAHGPRLPWQTQQTDYCTGALARDAMSRQPGRVASSAKSWLSHDGVDRTADILPWHGDNDVRRLSPVEVASRYLRHITGAWDHAHRDHRLADQDVIITLPASFDEVARELTVKAAKKAGLPRIYLIEEPQAAFYAWIDRRADDWQSVVQAGRLILVCDIGGGTTDLTLIRVRSAEGNQKLQFHRVAVGKHLLLGGDNLDLAIAKLAESKLPSPLQPALWQRLVAASRGVKELMLAEDRPDQTTIHLAGEGSSLLAGGIQIELTAAEIDAALVDGFFPLVKLDDAPETGQSGFQEFGLPYEADAAVTRHLADFLRVHRWTGRDDEIASDEITSDANAEDKNADRSADGGDGGLATNSDRPDLVLFNGGVMASGRLCDRIVDSISNWFGDDGTWRPSVLDSPRLDLAVARGAAYFGMVRRDKGVRIAANLGHSYYLQVGQDPPRAMCVIPGSAEAGQSFRCSQHPLELEIGSPAQFPLWVSSTRLADPVGEIIDVDAAELSPLPPITTVLTRGRKRQTDTVDVVVESGLSEIGTVGLFCVDAAEGRRWKLEFDIRSTLETDREAHVGAGESAGIMDDDVAAACRESIMHVFGDPAEAASGAAASTKPGGIVKALQRVVGANKNEWPPSLLRQNWRALMDADSGRRRSAAHEARWLSMVGFSLRPGFGIAADDWRVATLWRTLHGKLAFAVPSSRTESMILWRRVAGGLTGGQQIQLAAPLIASLRGSQSVTGKSAAGKSKLAAHEIAEAWRLVASLEHLPVAEKTTLCQIALTMQSQKKNEKIFDVLTWSLGRLASRLPVYGPINQVVAAGDAAEVAKEIIAHHQNHARKSAEPIDSATALSLALIGRKTGDRFRDLSSPDRQTIGDYLQSRSAADSLVRLVIEGGELQNEQQSEILGDSIPLGIRLRSSPR